jgi:hypothetical protein
MREGGRERYREGWGSERERRMREWGKERVRGIREGEKAVNNGTERKDGKLMVEKEEWEIR